MVWFVAAPAPADLQTVAGDMGTGEARDSKTRHTMACRMTFELKIDMTYGTLEMEFESMKEFEEKLNDLDVERLEEVLEEKFGHLMDWGDEEGGEI